MRKRFFSIGIIAIILIAIFGLAAGNGYNFDALMPKSRYTATFLDLFDTRTELTGYAHTEDEFRKQAEVIKEHLGYYNELFDIYHEYEGLNNIKTINDNAGKKPVEVSNDIIDLLDMGIDIYEETEGRVNIAFGSVLLIWHDYREAGIDNPESAELPDIKVLKEAAEHTDINDIIIDRENGTVYLKDSELSLDVGSIAKGYAAQKAMEYAGEQGFTNMLLSLGGNVTGIDGRIDGSRFRLGVQNPDLDSDKEYVEVVETADGESVVSSGDYQRYYIVDGNRYCHIINPDTLFPADEFAQVSVICDDSALADAYSTALFIMDIDEGMDFVNSRDGVCAMWVMHDGSKVYSERFEEYIVK